MEVLARPLIHVRCAKYSHRTRMLGVRCLGVTSRTEYPRLRPSAAPSTARLPETAPTSGVENGDSIRGEIAANYTAWDEIPEATSKREPRPTIKAKPERILKTAPTPTSKPDHKATPDHKAALDPASESLIPKLLTLKPQNLHSYTTSPVPTAAQLQHSNAFFHSIPAHLWTGAYFRQFPSSFHPEVAFLGRSNVGKSSILNALFNRPRARTAHVSKKPGRTRTMNAFGVGPEKLNIAKDTESWKSLGRGGVVVVDMPGYGKGSREAWGTEIMKYLEKRKQLRMTFLLVDVVHGLKTTDVQLLQHLRKAGIQHQIILSKVDKLLYPNPKPPSAQKLHTELKKIKKIIQDIRKKVEQPTADILCVSAEKDLVMEGMPKAGRLGVDAVRWAVLRACGLDCDEQGRPRKMETFAAAEEVEPTEAELKEVQEKNAKLLADMVEEEKEEQEYVRYRPMH